MSADVQQPVNPSLSPRAGIAMLTLQIRATLQEAAEVEAQYVDIDHDAAKRQLRERLEPLVQERTRSFTEAIDAARAEAARSIAAAHDEASRVRSEAAARAAAALAAAEQAAAEQAAAEQAAAEQAAADEAERVAAAEAERIAAEEAALAAAAIDATALDATPDWALLDAETDTVIEEPALVDEPEVVEVVEVTDDPVEVLQPSEVFAAPITITTDTATDSPFARQTLPPPPPQQINVSIDAEAFAKVFATVFASIVEQRLQHVPPAPAYVPYAIAPPAPAAPVKQGFWHHARHPDVLLLGLATAIVLVVLAAWLA
jgi:hypothetical protein